MHCHIRFHNRLRWTHHSFGHAPWMCRLELMSFGNLPELIEASWIAVKKCFNIQILAICIEPFLQFLISWLFRQWWKCCHFSQSSSWWMPVFMFFFYFSQIRRKKFNTNEFNWNSKLLHNKNIWLVTITESSYQNIQLVVSTRNVQVPMIINIRLNFDTHLEIIWNVD